MIKLLIAYRFPTMPSYLSAFWVQKLQKWIHSIHAIITLISCSNSKMFQCTAHVCRVGQVANLKNEILRQWGERNNSFNSSPLLLQNLKNFYSAKNIENLMINRAHDRPCAPDKIFWHFSFEWKKWIRKIEWLIHWRGIPFPLLRLCFWWLNSTAIKVQ